jgi:hypothetical protein
MAAFRYLTISPEGTGIVRSFLVVVVLSFISVVRKTTHRFSFLYVSQYHSESSTSKKLLVPNNIFICKKKNEMTTHYKEQEQVIENEHHDQEQEIGKDGDDGVGQCGGGLCGFIHRNRVTTILGFAIIGVALGIGLSTWEPENAEAKNITVQWIGLIGDLFLRALICFVLPVSLVKIKCDVYCAP